jgi:hypothetical protein
LQKVFVGPHFCITKLCLNRVTKVGVLHFILFIPSLDASRSSNDDASGSLDDQDRFRIEPRSGNLEAIAQSQEKDAFDVESKEHPSSSKASKKIGTKKEVILLTSSGGPPLESSRHVSMSTFLICFLIITLSVAP